MKQQGAYSALANYYDKLINDYCDYDKWSQYLYQLLSSQQAKKGVDLACGTGIMTALLRKRGFDVIGVDSSVAMLNIARSNSNGVFVQSDMRTFCLNKKVDFFCCVNDGINYIQPDDIAKLFAKIFGNLNSGGVFVFDISSQYKLSTIIGNNIFYYDDDKCTCLWSNKLHKDSVTMELTLFELQDNGLYAREDERHCQYIHDAKAIEQCLRDVGFGKVDVVDCYSTAPVKANTQRITFAAYKQ